VPIQRTDDGAKDCSDYSFHMTLTPWMNNQMVLPWITQNLGKKTYIFAADYAWGSDNIESISAWLVPDGLSLLCGEAARELQLSASRRAVSLTASSGRAK
jgi:hypothetical protein